MKIKIAYILFFLLAISQFLLLHFLGISTFVTTLCFYGCVFLLMRWMVNVFPESNWKNIFLHNFKMIIIVFIITEFSSSFLFDFRNTYMENRYHIYFSEYMKTKQVLFLNKIGVTKSKNAWEEGYGAFYKRRHTTKEFDYEMNYNEIGLRGKLPSLQKQEKEIRIVVLGDSFVEGYGTNETATFPFLLEKYLKNDSIPMTVINAGVCGSNPFNEITLYNNLLKKYNPDIVLLETNSGDVDDIDKAVYQGKMPLNEYFYAISHIYRIVQAMINDNHLYAVKREKIELKKSNIIIGILNSFNQELLKNSQELIVIHLPLPNEVYSQSKGLGRSDVATFNFKMIDLQKEYKKYIPEKSDSLKVYYWMKDRHHTPAGYDLMAKIVARQLITNKYLHSK